MTRDLSTLTPLLLAALALLALPTGCFTLEGNDTGADENQQVAGWQDRGRDPGSFQVDGYEPDGTPTGGGGEVVDGPSSWTEDGVWAYALSYSDVILSPDGGWLLAMVPVPGPGQGWAQPGLVLVAQELPDGDLVVFESSRDLARINFAPDGSAAYLLHSDYTSLSRLDLETLAVTPLPSFQGAYKSLDVSPDGRYLIGSNLPTTDAEELLFNFTNCGDDWGFELPAGASRCELSAVDLLTGGVWRTVFDLPLRDLDPGAHDGEIVTTMSSWNEETGDPETTLTFVGLKDGVEDEHVVIPNCADELKRQPHGTLALLAPRECQTLQQQSADPISVIDLADRTFLGNLPGFGPVVISEDGARAVGFTRRADMLQQWDYTQQAEVGLITVELPSLAWSVLDYGDTVPGYHLAVDGVHLYTYEPNAWGLPMPLSLVDLADRTIEPVLGPDVGLVRFVEARDSHVIYAVRDDVLVSIAVGTAEAVPVPVAFEGDLINVDPAGELVVVGRADAPMFTLIPVADPESATEIVLSL